MDQQQKNCKYFTTTRCHTPTQQDT